MTADMAVARPGDSMTLMVSNSCEEMPASRMARPAMPSSSRLIAVPPAKANQMKHISAGTIIAPRTNSRRLRPRDMRARNSPTKGAKAIHQAQ